jgi:hypothetical protein
MRVFDEELFRRMSASIRGIDSTAGGGGGGGGGGAWSVADLPARAGRLGSAR